ncbi:MAG: bacterial Ig-like domain-containing protein [Ruminococcus sp.]|nr:bacterial Ig-like domain-containing protein [Ruminococcus sp.]
MSGGWVYVTYPLTGGGSKSGYVYLNDFVPDSSRLTHFYDTTVTQQTDTFRKSDMAENFGWVSVGDVITVVGKSGNKLQVLYPVDDQYGGGYKIAWIYNTYIKKNLTGISVTSQLSKTTYLEGENLSTSGLVITASYDDGSTANVTGSCSFSGYDSTPGVKTVTVTYSGKQTAFTVNVATKTPTALTIVGLPNKTDYQVGDSPDFSGLDVKVEYDNGTEEIISGFDLIYDENITATTGSKDVTVSYMYNNKVVSSTFAINVIKNNEIYVNAVSVNTLPNKTTYKIGESFNSTGLSIKVEYSNGDSEIISTGFELKGFNSSSSGKKTITVSYKTKQTTFSVTVSDEVDENAPLISLNDTSAVLNDSFVVDLSITNNPGITALQVEIEFDEDVLELKKVSHKNLFENISTGGQSLTSPYKISWFSQSSKNETANGIFAQLEFKFKENVTVENTTITICYDEENIFDTEFNNISFQTRNSVVSLNKVKYGDVNDDKTINMKDIVLLQQYLNKYQVTINQEASDIFYDSKINMKDIAVLQQYLNGYDVTLGKPSGAESNDTYTSFVYGSSELGRDLVCHAFTPKQYNDTVLLNFAIHGFEDEYDHDGQVLVDNANKLIEYYKANPDKLGSTRLLIIPSANPDGLIDGYDNDAFGRCNANGIDLNRDFDANYISQSTPRYYTPSAFSASESRALRDLVLEYSPTVVLDIHGWLDETIGDYEIGQIFEEEMDLQHYVGFTNYNARGYFANWAHQQGALGLLVELKSSNNVQYEKLVTSINRILNKDYEYSDTDSRFSEFESIECYTLTKDRSDTFKYFDKPYSAASYIDGKTDLVTIFKVYDNGWVKCQYPIVNGYKTAYCKLEAFIDADNVLDEFYEYSVSANTSVYKCSDLSESFGTVYPTDKITVIAETESALQIIYPLDNGGYKMGWITK